MFYNNIIVRPNHDLKYTIGTNFCLEDSPLNRMGMQNWEVSCQLANQPIPPPMFNMAIELLRDGMKTELSNLIFDDMNLTLIFYDLNLTVHSLFDQDISAIRVTCFVSNTFGSDNASTLIEPCGNKLHKICYDEC